MRLNRLKEICIDISMSIIDKMFHYEESELSVIKCKDEIWLRDKTVTEILRYTNQRNNNNKKRSHTQLDSRKQVIAFQDRVITINIKEAQHPLK